MTRKEAFVLGYVSRFWTEGISADEAMHTLKTAEALIKLGYFWREHPDENKLTGFAGLGFNAVRLLTRPTDERDFEGRDVSATVRAYEEATKQVRERTKALLAKAKRMGHEPRRIV